MFIEFSPPRVQLKFEPPISKQEHSSLLPPQHQPQPPPPAPPSPSIPPLMTKVARKIVLPSVTLRISVTKPPIFVHKDNIIDETILPSHSTFVLEPTNVHTSNLNLSVVQVKFL